MCLAFGDAGGAVHLLTAAAEESSLPLNGFDGQPIDWIEPPEPLPNIVWNDMTCVYVLSLFQIKRGSEIDPTDL